MKPTNGDRGLDRATGAAPLRVSTVVADLGALRNGIPANLRAKTIRRAVRVGRADHTVVRTVIADLGLIEDRLSLPPRRTRSPSEPAGDVAGAR